MIRGLVLAIVVSTTEAAPPQTATQRCCLTNPAHRGVCVVALGENETCEDVLAYLNAPNTTGRTYCNSTRLRGGWKKVPCPPATPAPATAILGRHDVEPSATCSLAAPGRRFSGRVGESDLTF